MRLYWGVCQYIIINCVLRGKGQAKVAKLQPTLMTSGPHAVISTILRNDRAQKTTILATQSYITDKNLNKCIKDILTWIKCVLAHGPNWCVLAESEMCEHLHLGL